MATSCATAPPRIAILARAPVPGQAKTRLIPALGADGAAQLQAQLLERSVATALAAGLGPVWLWCTPDADHPAFRKALHDGIHHLVQQPDGDLGARMHAACVEPAGTDGSTLVIGTDCPALTPAHLRQAAACLAQGDDAVILPAEDGGYVLIGVARAAATLFADIEWGSERVMAQTRRQLVRLGWQWREPTRLWDVDRVADLQRMRHLPSWIK